MLLLRHHVRRLLRDVNVVSSAVAGGAVCGNFLLLNVISRKAGHWLEPGRCDLVVWWPGRTVELRGCRVPASGLRYACWLYGDWTTALGRQ